MSVLLAHHGHKLRLIRFPDRPSAAAYAVRMRGHGYAAYVVPTSPAPAARNAAQGGHSGGKGVQ